MNEQQLFETWQINNRINLYLLESIAEENLSATMTSKGRSAGEQFAHVHNVRLMWLKAAQPELLVGQTKIEKDRSLDKKLLAKSLTESGEAILKLLETSAANGGRVKGFKPHVTAFVGYLCAHDAHHRSQAIIALKQAGHKVDQKTGFGIWEWGTR